MSRKVRNPHDLTFILLVPRTIVKSNTGCTSNVLIAQHKVLYILLLYLTDYAFDHDTSQFCTRKGISPLTCCCAFCSRYGRDGSA